LPNNFINTFWFDAEDSSKADVESTIAAQLQAAGSVGVNPRVAVRVSWG